MKHKLQVLDFGAGFGAPHAARLRAEFPQVNIVAWDFGRNFQSEVHDGAALGRRYDLVYASNVLNVQSTLHALTGTIAQIAWVTASDGMAVANYPGSPRKMPYEFGHQAMSELLWEFFRKVERIGGGYSTPVWRLTRPYRAKSRAAVLKFHSTQAEIQVANIRPTGIIVRNALVPRMIQALLKEAYESANHGRGLPQES